MRRKNVLLVPVIAAFLAGVIAQKTSVPKVSNKHSLAEEHARELLLLMDTDKNGKVTKQEWMKFMEAEFDRLDKDKKGELDQRELMKSKLRVAAGIVLGPAMVGRLPFASGLIAATKHEANILNFVYWLGLLLLMFLSGAETQQLFSRDERREVGWLAIVGTGIPFVLGLLFGPWLISPVLAGRNGNRVSLVIILAVGVAVTSVPVVSKIFADLKILHTRFARLVLGVAVLEDIVLWLALALATTLASKTVLHPRVMSYHLATTIVFFVLGLTLLPRTVKRINKSRFNVFATHAPVAYAIAVLLGYCVVAGALNVSLVFAAFLAGFAVVHKERRIFADALDAIGKVAFAFFIPVYFAIVGLKLDLVRGVSLWMMGTFIVGSCIVKILSVSLAGRLAGFRGLNLNQSGGDHQRPGWTWYCAG